MLTSNFNLVVVTSTMAGLEHFPQFRGIKLKTVSNQRNQNIIFNIWFESFRVISCLKMSVTHRHQQTLGSLAFRTALLPSTLISNVILLFKQIYTDHDVTWPGG